MTATNPDIEIAVHIVGDVSAIESALGGVLAAVGGTAAPAEAEPMADAVARARGVEGVAEVEYVEVEGVEDDELEDDADRFEADLYAEINARRAEEAARARRAKAST